MLKILLQFSEFRAILERTGLPLVYLELAIASRALNEGERVDLLSVHLKEKIVWENPVNQNIKNTFCGLSISVARRWSVMLDFKDTGGNIDYDIVFPTAGQAWKKGPEGFPGQDIILFPAMVYSNFDTVTLHIQTLIPAAKSPTILIVASLMLTAEPLAALVLLCSA